MSRDFHLGDLLPISDGMVEIAITIRIGRGVRTFENGRRGIDTYYEVDGARFWRGDTIVLKGKNFGLTILPAQLLHGAPGDVEMLEEEE